MKNKEPIVWSYWGHEPLRHLRRMGNDGDSIFTLGDWVEDWYDHIHSEELLKKASEAGINVIYTHYFKGFGLETEKSEMEQTRSLCEKAAKYGIKVLGYCQLGSLYNETLSDEIDNLEDWAIRDASGALVSWLGQYYRWSPCFNNRDFVDYIKKVIRYGLEHVGLSGFHFDNSYNVACHCPRCTQAFRDYLTKHVKNPEKEMGLKHFRHVRIPREDPAEETHDTLYIWWLRYKADLCADVHRELFAYVKEVGGEQAIVLHNPCFTRPGKTFARRGFEPSRVSEDCDYIFAENSVGYIRVEDGRIKGQVDAFKFGERFGYRVFDTCWTHNHQGKARLPENREEVVRFVVQSMIYTGLCGSPWTVRSLKDGHKNLLENSPLSAALKEAFGYYHKYKDYFLLPSENHVKLLYVPDNVLCNLDDGIDVLRNCVEELVTEAVPFSIVTMEDLKKLDEEQIVLVPKVAYACEGLLEELSGAAKRGVKLLVIGHLGRYYEDGKERGHSHWIFDKKEEQGFYRTGAAFMPLLRQLIKPYDIIISERGIMLETRTGMEGELVVHLLNVDNDKILERVEINFQGFELASVDCFSLEDTEVEKIGNSQLILKNLQTTATLIIRRKA